MRLKQVLTFFFFPFRPESCNKNTAAKSENFHECFLTLNTTNFIVTMATQEVLFQFSLVFFPFFGSSLHL